MIGVLLVIPQRASFDKSFTTYLHSSIKEFNAELSFLPLVYLRVTTRRQSYQPLQEHHQRLWYWY